MAYIFPWRKAVAVSIFLHIFLLAAAGYLMAGLTVSVPADDTVVLEMDLINEPGINADLPQSPVQQQPHPAAPEPRAARPDTPAAERAPSVTADALSVIEADTPAPPAPAGPRTDNRRAAAGVSPAAAPASQTISGVAPPGILTRVEPVYPAIARQAGQQGTVLLKIEILVNGRPGRITITRSTSYPALDEAAVAAVRQWQFIPAKDLSSGRAIVCTTTLPVSFRLNN